MCRNSWFFFYYIQRVFTLIQQWHQTAHADCLLGVCCYQMLLSIKNCFILNIVSWLHCMISWQTPNKALLHLGQSLSSPNNYQYWCTKCWCAKSYYCRPEIMQYTADGKPYPLGRAGWHGEIRCMFLSIPCVTQITTVVLLQAMCWFI